MKSPPFFVWKKSRQIGKRRTLCLLLMFACFRLRFGSREIWSKGRNKELKADQK